MPRDVTVTLDNGEQVLYKGVPDNVGPETVAERAAKESGRQAVELDGGKGGAARSPLGQAAHYGKLTVSALGRGLASLPALVADLNLINPETGAPVKGMPITDRVQATGTRPETEGEKYLNSGLEGLAGGMGPGMAVAPLRTATVATASGLGAEAGGQLSQGSLLGRLLGGLAGGGIAGLASGVKSTRDDLVKEVTRDAAPADMQAAAGLMKQAQQEGVSLNLAQAMGAPSNLDKAVETLAQSRHGAETTRQLRAQPNDVGMLADREVAGLPGAVRSPTDAATNLHEAAGSAIAELKKQRTDLWGDTLERATKALHDSKQPAIDATTADVAKLSAARQNLEKELVAAQQALASRADPATVARAVEKATQATAAALKESAGRSALRSAEVAQANITKVPESVVGGEANRLRALAAKTPNTPMAKLLNEFADDLMVKGKPITDARALNEIFKATNAKVTQPNLSTPGVDAGVAKFLQQQVAKTRERLGEGSEPFRRANRAYAEFTESALNPARGSVTGRFAGVRGFDSSKEMAPARMNALFDAGTVPGSTKSDILTLEKAVRGQPNGPEAFQDAVKTWMAEKVAKAVKGTGRRTDEGTAQRLVTALIGDKTKEAGLTDIMVGLARSRGLADNALGPGMKNALRIIEAAARRPGNVAGTTAKEINQAGRSPLLDTVGSINFVQPLRSVNRAVNDVLNGDALRFVDRLITSPEGVETLIKLGKQPVMSKAAANTLATFLATGAAASE